MLSVGSYEWYQKAHLPSGFNQTARKPDAANRGICCNRPEPGTIRVSFRVMLLSGVPAGYGFSETSNR